MGFAYSGGPIIWQTNLRGDTTSHLVTDLDTVVTAAGWGFRTAITGGFKYTMNSPQGLVAKCKIYDFDGTNVRIQFLSSDEVRVGYPHVIRAGATYEVYQAHCGPCQLFTSVNGQGTNKLSSFQGGIPYCSNVTLIGDCAVANGPGLATECWWSSGNASADDFRVSHKSSTFSACYNGNLIDSKSFLEIARLRLSTLCFATNVEFTFGYRQRAQFFNNLPLRVEPLILWGDTSVKTATVKGQTWDSLITTLPLALDQEVTIIDDETGFPYKFINYMFDDNAGTQRTRYGSLLLLESDSVLSQQGAYWYVH